MASLPPEGSGLADELAIDLPEHAKPRLKDKFLPWHKPRKHWIRKHQWAAEAANLVKELRLAEKRRPLVYSSLPGPHMLDVRLIHGACAGADIGLRFLGFMTGKRDDVTELNISLDEVNKLPGVDSRSVVVPSDLQSLADSNSVAYSRAEDAAPFDIVNIDLCDSIGGAPPLDEQKGCYEAIRRIIELQARKRPPDEPWLLFVTTRANQETIDGVARERFFDCLLDNAREHAAVRDALSEASLSSENLVAFRDGNAEEAAPFERAFAAAVGKWLLKMIGSGQPAGTLDLLPTSCVYGIRAEGMSDMLSLGFRCRTITAPPEDRLGLARPAPVTAADSEPVAAAKIIRGVPAMRCVDELLTDDGAFAEVAREAAEQMRLARFDTDKYLKWAMEPRRARSGAEPAPE